MSFENFVFTATAGLILDGEDPSKSIINNVKAEINTEQLENLNGVGSINRPQYLTFNEFIDEEL